MINYEGISTAEEIVGRKCLYAIRRIQPAIYMQVVAYSRTSMFSQRTGWSRDETWLAQTVAARRTAGLPLIDLAASNPTRCGFAYDKAAILDALTSERSLQYEPQPLGLPEARRAVCAYYRDRNAIVEPDQVCLTTSTSEAYSFLFRLLCDPGDEVLITEPSYPLFDFLADLDDVKLVRFPLFYDHGWQTEPGSLEPRITLRTRAIIVVHPNNPTGHYVSAADRDELYRVCARHGLALIVDEVFLDYPLAGTPTSFAGGEPQALTFVLSGLSKVAALPQMKVSWIVAAGPQPQRDEALARLELIADTFLSMSAPVQHALPTWLAESAKLQAQLSERTRSNLAVLDALLAADGTVQRLQLEAGWYAILRVPAMGSDDALVMELAERWGVLVHPGHYYGFAGAGWLVVSLLPQLAEFEQGIKSLLACCAQRVRDALTE